MENFDFEIYQPQPLQPQQQQQQSQQQQLQQSQQQSQQQQLQQFQQQFLQQQIQQQQQQIQQQLQDQRHQSNLYSKIIFKNNSQEIKDYIEYLDQQLKQQRFNRNGNVEVKLLELLGHYHYELKTLESLQRSIELYREAFSILTASPLSYQQVDYAYVMACTARSQYIYDFINGLKGQNHGGGIYYELDKRSYNCFESALGILYQLDYQGPYIGMILNMQVSCSLYARSRLWEPDEEKLSILRDKLNNALLNFKSNNYNDFHQDCSETYYLYGILECHYRSHQSMDDHRKLSQQYFNIALQGFRLHFGQSHPMMAYIYYRMSDCYDMEIRSQNLNNYNSFFKDCYKNNLINNSSNNSFDNLLSSSYDDFNESSSSSSGISYRNNNKNNNFRNNNYNNDNSNINHINHNNKPILYESIALRYDALTIIKSYYGPNHIETIPIIESIFCTLNKYGLTNPSLQRENLHIQRINDIPLSNNQKEIVKCKCSIQ